ncbi:hypothetical protein PR202_ga08780 [Eleusine coracana subsp. coracana]|uniref:Trigger factor ribosome-binding bacterial domain-containing protein n=1 Tax=Eleusine coracana subsp. coracana TaxID=191504 RepID=A0AAV5C3G6_ELECO|nr:hypothetical protein PR202_ga08780 [Eleusine coracana subsp. coracana]
MASAATFPKLRFGPRCHNYTQFRFSEIASTAKVSSGNAGAGSSIAADESKNDLSLENVKMSIVSRNDEKINVRVQLPGKATQKVFDEALVILSRDAPPVPGFRKSKGDTQQHPLADAGQKPGHQVCARYDIDLLMIQENLKVNPEIETTQSEAEMESAFKPGSAFGFNVILQLEKSDTDEDSEEQSDTSE